MKTLGQRLRTVRVDAGLTLQDIADRIAIAPMYVSDIERGRRVPAKRPTLIKIAEAYGLTIEEVEDLALYSRGSVQLETNDEPRKEAAVALARVWQDMSTRKLARLRQLAEEDEDGTD